MRAAFCKEKRNLWDNTWCIGFTMRLICAILRASTVGLATRCLWLLTNEHKMGNDMIASNYEGTAPTGQTSAQGIPIPCSTLVVGAVPFFVRARLLHEH